MEVLAERRALVLTLAEEGTFLFCFGSGRGTRFGTSLWGPLELKGKGRIYESRQP
jgi:hypothetical protein